jgi:hypothetical protein
MDRPAQCKHSLCAQEHRTMEVFIIIAAVLTLASVGVAISDGD